MCGIVGFVDKKTQSEKAVIIKDMMDAIIHRGPNSAGQYIDDDAALGFRRLSIIDLEGGSQPLYNEDNTKVKPGYKKKRAAAIDRVHRQKKREMIRSKIREEKKAMYKERARKDREGL